MKDYTGKSIFANCIRGFEGVGGKIHFDATGLTFKSHAINIQTGDVRMAYSEISEVKKRKTGGFVPNGMLVVTKDGAAHKFVINNRTKVIEFIQQQILASTSA